MSSSIKVRIFRKAKELLKRSRSDRRPSTYICHAIQQAEQLLDADLTGLRLRRLILERLDDYYTLDEWLCSKLDIESPLNPNKLQQTRHAWIDSLIAEFERKDREHEAAKPAEPDQR